MHDDDNPQPIFSLLCKSVNRDNVTVEVHISRLAGEDDWAVEIVDQDDGSTDWNEFFDTAAEALDEALKATSASRKAECSMVVARGPVRRYEGDVFRSARWPIACVVAWRWAQLAGLSEQARNDLVREAAEHGYLAIDGTTPDWSELIQEACREILDMAATKRDIFRLRGRDEAPISFGASAELRPYNKSFALFHDRFHDFDDRVEDLWCIADDVQKVFASSPPSTLKGRTACLEWLRAEMEASPSKTDVTKSDWADRAKEKFGVTKTQFKQIWADAKHATGAEWGRAGRKPKKHR